MLHQGDEGGTNLGPVMETIREVTNNAADADNAVVGGGNQDAAVENAVGGGDNQDAPVDAVGGGDNQGAGESVLLHALYTLIYILYLTVSYLCCCRCRRQRCSRGE